MASTAPIDDPQRERVYEMEDSELRGHYAHHASRKRLKRALNALCRDAGIPKAILYVRRFKTRCGYYEPFNRIIELDSEEGANYLVLCHEFAHHATWCKSPNATDHGPTWMKWYAWAADTVGLVPIAGMRAVARKYKVKIAR